jgi:hypothetical protein
LGILWPHSNALAFNNAGARALGAKAYFFEAGTTTPRTTYTDAALSTPHTHPVLADGNGRFPAIFLDFGDYRERVRTAGDTTIWDTDNIPNDAPADPGEGVAADAILTTGDVFFAFRSGTRDGAVRCNGRTVGSATSGATERANADCQNLFIYLWNNFSDAILAVSGGRGASASADWTANKTIALFDLRGALLGGLADMGSSNAGHYNPTFVPAVVGGATTGGSTLGSNTHLLTLAQTPAHSHTVGITTGTESVGHTHAVNLSTDSQGSHTHTINITDTGHSHTTGTGGNSGLVASAGSISSGAGPQYVNNGTLGVNSSTTGITASSVSNGAHTHNVNGTSGGVSASHTHSISGSTGSQGSDGFHNNLPRTVIGTFFIKL